ILARAPLFWWRVRAEKLRSARVAELVGAAGARVRYVAPARIGSQQWAPLFASGAAKAAAPVAWPGRRATVAPERRDGGYWFLSAEGGGVAAIREATGTGAGTRLAV